VMGRLGNRGGSEGAVILVNYPRFTIHLNLKPNL
jgi:hypothetical protein